MWKKEIQDHLDTLQEVVDWLQIDDLDELKEYRVKDKWPFIHLLERIRDLGLDLEDEAEKRARSAGNKEEPDEIETLRQCIRWLDVDEMEQHLNLNENRGEHEDIKGRIRAMIDRREKESKNTNNK